MKYHWLISLVLLIGVSGCRKGVELAAIEHVINSADDELIVFYELMEAKDKTVPATPKAIFFYVQGSEYESVINKADMMASAVIFGARAIMVEKRGCRMNEVDLQKAYRFSEKEVRVQDYLTVLDTVLPGVSPNIPVILIGGSEGGDIAAEVASIDNRVSHLVLIGSGGGMSPEQELRYFVKQEPGYLGFNQISELDSVLHQIKTSDSLMKFWAGHPYKRWKSYMNDSSLTYVKELNIPILLIHGEADENVPVQSARRLDSAMRTLGKENLEYIEYPHLDHSLINVNDQKSRYPYLEIDLINWLNKHGIVNDFEANIFISRVKKNHKEIFPNN